MFETLLASRLPGLAWRRPAVVAVLLHGAVVAAVATTAKKPPEPAVEPDTVRLQMALPLPPQPRRGAPTPSIPTPTFPALPPIPPLKLEPFPLGASALRASSMVRSLAAEMTRSGAMELPGSEPQGDSIFTTLEVDRPPELAQEVRPRYPDELRETGLTGMVQLEYVIASSGRIDKATMQVQTSTHPAFSRTAIDALLAARFRPALRNGRPVPVRVQQTIRFLTR
jgi:TonB family protein